jgi:hypothetical protein
MVLASRQFLELRAYSIVLKNFVSLRRNRKIRGRIFPPIEFFLNKWNEKLR